jgi:hypothetical protein
MTWPACRNFNNGPSFENMPQLDHDQEEEQEQEQDLRHNNKLQISASVIANLKSCLWSGQTRAFRGIQRLTWGVQAGTGLVGGMDVVIDLERYFEGLSYVILLSFILYCWSVRGFAEIQLFCVSVRGIAEIIMYVGVYVVSRKSSCFV